MKESSGDFQKLHSGSVVIKARSLDRLSQEMKSPYSDERYEHGFILKRKEGEDDLAFRTAMEEMAGTVLQLFLADKSESPKQSVTLLSEAHLKILANPSSKLFWVTRTLENAAAVLLSAQSLKEATEAGIKAKPPASPAKKDFPIAGAELAIRLAQDTVTLSLQHLKMLAAMEDPAGLKARQTIRQLAESFRGAATKYEAD